ncbi:MAG TPA: SDR family oxidoreductase [Novosphingobium sp.]|nr:SDR family oxidoreductase [Novosphingobium sp.]
MDFSLDRFRLDGKVAIVTGVGGKGNSIGRAYAIGLARAGASVVLANRTEVGAMAVAEEIEAEGGRAIGIHVDVTDEASTLAMAQAAVTAFGGIDILVNNAALMTELTHQPVDTTSLEEWDRILAVNLTGPLLCTRAVVPTMRRRGGGRIVNMSSAGAYPATTLYGVSKIALVGLTTTIAKQLGRDNITCNAIAPGNIRTGGSNVTDDSPFVRHLETIVATRARGNPDELVGALLMLCSPAGDFITGQVIHIDGGWVMRP